MPRYASALITRLEHYVPLASEEIAAVECLERDEVKMARGSQLLNGDTGSGSIFVLRAGWAVLRTQQRRGQSSIANVFLPGDLIGLANVGTAATPHPVTMQTAGTVARFDRASFPDLWRTQPRLMSLITSIGGLHHIALQDKVFALTRLDAVERMMFFLLGLRARLAISIGGMGDRFHLPFNQQEIGDILGITSVYVNKLLRQLSEAGDIEVDRPYIRLLRREEWIARLEFVDRFAELDTTWFPQAA